MIQDDSHLKESLPHDSHLDDIEAVKSLQFLRKMENEDVAEALQSSRWQTRMAALRTIDERRLEIPDLQTIHRMSRSTNIPERYWLAKVLALSRTPETYSSLLVFLDGSSPNVVCMSLFAMGQRGESNAIRDILTWMESSDHWYCKWYAYRALKALGWKQSKLK